MTWRAFKQQVAAQGVNDDDPVAEIAWSTLVFSEGVPLRAVDAVTVRRDAAGWIIENIHPTRPGPSSTSSSER